MPGVRRQCPLLLQVDADLRELFRRHGLTEDAAPDLLTLRLAAGDTLPDEEWGQVHLLNVAAPLHGV
jgi:hypothetical protein